MGPVDKSSEVAATYLEFLKETLPKGWTTKAPHIQAKAEHLDALLSGQIDRLAIHEPPRHGKTETVTVRLPVRCLREHPSENYLITGYNQRFANRLSRKARTVAAGRVRLDPLKTAVDEWATLDGGVVMARGVGSPPTGTGFKGIAMDDPIRRREDAESVVFREKLWDWYTDDLYTRLEPGGWIVLTMTLWHEDDVGARAVASEPGRWTVLKLPAIALPDDPLGRAVGDALWPERFDVEALTRIREVMLRNEGERSWQALYQQNPTPKEGTLFKVSQIEIINANSVAISHLNNCLAFDLGATENDGNWTAGMHMFGPDKDGIYYGDVFRFRHEPAERNRRMRQEADLRRPRTVRAPQDPGAAGKESAKTLVKLFAGHNIKTETVSGDKYLRAEPFAAQVNAGNFKLIDSEFARDYIEELRQAPGGTFDDFIDASSDAFNELAGSDEELVAKVIARNSPTVNYVPR